ncbi:hypothetical protein ABIF61_000391 [Bradyrhizobium japonicum]
MAAHPRGAFRPSFAILFRPYLSKGAGKAGRRLAPEVPRVRKKRARGGRQVMPVARPSLRDGFHGVLRALPGERCTIAPVALQMADARARSGRHITASLDAQTPGVRTTRLLRPRTSPSASPTAGVRSPSGPNKDAVSAVSYRACRCSRFPALQPSSRADAVAATASRPASRDDRETPLVAGGMCRLVRQSRISVNANILRRSHRPTAGVFCPTGNTSDRSPRCRGAEFERRSHRCIFPGSGCGTLTAM